ncbi:MAG TPA: hypothetical protein VIS99_07370 [Terrimicrobiaceae bacterium]
MILCSNHQQILKGEVGSQNLTILCLPVSIHGDHGTLLPRNAAGIALEQDLHFVLCNLLAFTQYIGSDLSIDNSIGFSVEESDNNA